MTVKVGVCGAFSFQSRYKGTTVISNTNNLVRPLIEFETLEGPNQGSLLSLSLTLFGLCSNKRPRERKTLTLTLMATSSAAENLEDVPSVDLMTELLRRMKCSTKPDKRLILVGILDIYIHTHTRVRRDIHMDLSYLIAFFFSFCCQILVLDVEILSDPRV